MPPWCWRYSRSGFGGVTGDLVHALAELGRRSVGQERDGDAGVARLPRLAAVVAAVDAGGRDGDQDAGRARRGGRARCAGTARLRPAPTADDAGGPTARGRGRTCARRPRCGTGRPARHRRTPHRAVGRARAPAARSARATSRCPPGSASAACSSSLHVAPRSSDRRSTGPQWLLTDPANSRGEPPRCRCTSSRSPRRGTPARRRRSCSRPSSERRMNRPLVVPTRTIVSAVMAVLTPVVGGTDRGSSRSRGRRRRRRCRRRRPPAA